MCVQNTASVFVFDEYATTASILSAAIHRQIRKKRRFPEPFLLLKIVFNPTYMQIADVRTQIILNDGILINVTPGM